MVSYSHDIIDIGLLISGREPALASWTHSEPEHRETYWKPRDWTRAPWWTPEAYSPMHLQRRLRFPSGANPTARGRTIGTLMGKTIRHVQYDFELPHFKKPFHLYIILYLSLSLSLYIYIYLIIFIYVCGIYVYRVYIYIYMLYTYIYV